MSEFNIMCQSTVVESVAGFAACVHIINAVRTGQFLSKRTDLFIIETRHLLRAWTYAIVHL